MVEVEAVEAVEEVEEGHEEEGQEEEEGWEEGRGASGGEARRTSCSTRRREACRSGSASCCACRRGSG